MRPRDKYGNEITLYSVVEYGEEPLVFAGNVIGFTKDNKVEVHCCLGCDRLFDPKELRVSQMFYDNDDE